MFANQTSGSAAPAGIGRRVALYVRSRNGGQFLGMASSLIPMAGLYLSVVGITRSFEWGRLLLYLVSSATLFLAVIFDLRIAPRLADRFFYANEGYVRPPGRTVHPLIWTAYGIAFLLPAFLLVFGAIRPLPAMSMSLLAFALFELILGPRTGSLTDTILGGVVLCHVLVLSFGLPVFLDAPVIAPESGAAPFLNVYLPTVMGSILVEWAVVATGVLAVNRFAWRRLRA